MYVCLFVFCLLFDSAQQQYDPKADLLYRAYLAATIIGVAGGVIGLCILYRQFVATRIAADAAKNSADAAHSTIGSLEKQLMEMQKAREQTDRLIEAASAQVSEMRNAGKQTAELIKHAEGQLTSLKNTERPWLFIEIKTTGVVGTPVGEIPQHMGFSVSFRNWGKTPAEVVAFDQHPDCRKDLTDLPWPPEYSPEREVMVQTRMVPPGEVWLDPGESYFQPETFLGEDEWKEIRNSQKRFIYWGRIQYRDLIEESKTIHEIKEVGTIHETCFCYFWSPRLDEFLICGPLGYNKHT
jgi:hypothetical protein